MSKFWAAVLTLALILGAGSASAFVSIFAGGAYQYISATELNKRVQARDAMVIVDISPAHEFAAGHIRGSIGTNAFPVQTNEERTRLNKTLELIRASGNDVIVVCPRGRGGAKRTVDHLRSKGVDPKRIYILSDGLHAWPYEKVR